MSKAARVSQSPSHLDPSIFYLSIIMTLCRRSCRKRVLQEYQKAKLVFFNHRADLELYDYKVAQELICQIKKLDRRIQKYGIKCDRCTRE